MDQVLAFLTQPLSIAAVFGIIVITYMKMRNTSLPEAQQKHIATLTAERDAASVRASTFQKEADSQRTRAIAAEHSNAALVTEMRNATEQIALLTKRITLLEETVAASGEAHS